MRNSLKKLDIPTWFPNVSLHKRCWSSIWWESYNSYIFLNMSRFYKCIRLRWPKMDFLKRCHPSWLSPMTRENHAQRRYQQLVSVRFRLPAPKHHPMFDRLDPSHSLNYRLRHVNLFSDTALIENRYRIEIPKI